MSGVTLLVWWPALLAYWWLDDFWWLFIYTRDQLPTLEEVKWVFFPPGRLFSWYRPMGWPYWRIGGLLFGVEPAGYHAFSLALIAGSGVLLTLIVRRLKGGLFVSMAAGLVFVAHPALFTNAFWAATAHDNVSIFFGLGALAAALAAEEKRGLWAVSYAAFFAAILAKESALLLPLVLLSIYAARRFTGEELRALTVWPAAGLLAVLPPYMVMRFVTDSSSFWRLSSDYPIYEQSLFGSHIPENALFYAGLLWRPLVPQSLRPEIIGALPAADYVDRLWDVWQANPVGLTLAAGLGLALVVLAVRALIRREEPLLLIGWSWLIIGVLPPLPFTKIAYDWYITTAVPGFAVLVAASLSLLSTPARLAILAAFILLSIIYVYDKRDKHWLARDEILAERTMDGVMAEIPEMPAGSQLVIFNGDGWNLAFQALNGNYAPQVLYNQPDMMVFDGNGLHCSDGSWVAPQSLGRVEMLLNPARAIAFRVTDDEVRRLTTEEAFPADECPTAEATP